MPTHTTCTDPRQPWRDRDAVIEPCVRAAAAPRATSCPRRCPPPMPFAPMSLGPTRQANRNQPFRGQSFDIETRSSKITGPTNESRSAILTMPLRTLSSPRRLFRRPLVVPLVVPSSCSRRPLVVPLVMPSSCSRRLLVVPTVGDPDDRRGQAIRLVLAAERCRRHHHVAGKHPSRLDG